MRCDPLGGVALAGLRRDCDVIDPEKATNVPHDVFRLLFLEQPLAGPGARDTPRVHHGLHVPDEGKDELQGLGRIVGDVRIGAANHQADRNVVGHGAHA